GVRVSEAGAGGFALRDSGAGGPGGRLEGIGALATRGKGGGHQGYGSHAVCEGAECRKAELAPEPRVDDAVVGCAVPGACLDKELIRKVIRANLGGIRACYQYELTAHPELSGTVAVKFLISVGGGVTASEVVRSTTSSASLDQCVANRVRALRFPGVKAQGMATAVTYPFHFQPAGR
ncbi:MAG: TonB family protein, partial [Myxococcaceae bacterium]|nr:TonB family protein [Myxococcaceae bacterium]